MFYHTPIILAKELYNSKQNENDKIVKNSNNLLIKFKKYINIKKIPKNENLNKIFDIVEKFWTLINNKKVKDFLQTSLA